MITLTRHKGFSLIEMMISITIGLLIVAALVAVLSGNLRTAKTNDKTTELQSNGRFAMDHLRREIRHAGYRGYSWADPNAPTTALTPITNECLSVGAAAGSFVANIRQGIWGANDSNPFAASCLATGYLRGDLLAIRHVNTSQLNGNTTSGNFYLRSSYAAAEVFKGTGAATLAGAPIISGQPQADFQLMEYVYYIGSDDNNAALPALRRTSLTGSAMVDEMVVSGIEQIQVQYGRLNTASNSQYFNANAITGSPSDSPATNTQYAWDEVNTVRIWLLSRASKPETGYVNTNSYSMGDVNYGPMNDNFRRQLFTAVIELRN